MSNLTGTLLIANGNLFDPNFRQAVVLIADHSDEGALGVVLNRPGGFPVTEVVPALADVLPPEDELFIGGPVQPQAGVVLAEYEQPEASAKIAFGSIGFITEETDLLSMDGVRRARVFAGYAGWGPGQLESEIADDSWILERALPDDVFADAPEHLWSDLLKRKGGDYVLLASMPVDPTLN